MWCVDRSYLVSVDFTVFDSIGNISCEDLLENCNDNQRNQQIQLMNIYISLVAVFAVYGQCCGFVTFASFFS